MASYGKWHVADLSGWPKTGLSGSGGQEDFNSILNYEEYKVIVHDNLCGVVEKEIVTSCCALSIQIVQISDAVCGQAPYSYQWNTGATTSSVSKLSTGQHCITVTDANGCIKLACFNEGLNYQDVKYFKIYPNPTRDIVNLEYLIPNDGDEFTVLLYSFTGQLVNTFNYKSEGDNIFQFLLQDVKAGPIKVLVLQNSIIVFQSTIIKI